MSTYQVESSDFRNNILRVEIRSFIKGPVLLLNDKIVELKKGKGTIRDDSWAQRTVVLKNKFYDYPSVEIDGTAFYPMGKMGNIEKVFVMLPLGLIGVGGAIGGGLGALAAYTNSLLMLEYKKSNLKYVFSVVTSLCALCSWYLCAIMINTFLGR